MIRVKEKKNLSEGYSPVIFIPAVRLVFSKIKKVGVHYNFPKYKLYLSQDVPGKVESSSLGMLVKIDISSTDEAVFTVTEKGSCYFSIMDNNIFTGNPITGVEMAFSVRGNPYAKFSIYDTGEFFIYAR